MTAKDAPELVPPANEQPGGMRVESAAWLKPVRWQTFPRDFVVIQIGFALFALAIAFLIQSQLGTSPWVVLEVAVINYIPLTPGQSGILTGAIVLLLALALREPVGWGTLGNIICIGLWEDVALHYLPIRADLPGQVLYLVLAVLVMAGATAIYIGVNAGAGPRDSLMIAVARATGLSVRVARAGIEIAVVTSGWLLGGPVGIGTLIFAMAIGPAVQTAFRIFKVGPQRTAN
ncbi:MAG: hypothetical protein DWI62_02200 [Chloroflexi bacterium]|nr:MAG: hypothetical protein DWI62_02200 [Chloroflexota bacterium]